MKKTILLLGLTILTFLLVGCTGGTETNKTTNETSKSDNTSEIIVVENVKPERKMDIYGKIVANEGNEFTILEVDTSKDPTFGMAPADKKAYMMKMSQDQRKALKDEIRNATLANVKVMIPVGIPMLVKTASGPEAEEKMGSLVDMTIGSYVSIWYNPEIKDRKIAEYVKKLFTK